MSEENTRIISVITITREIDINQTGEGSDAIYIVHEDADGNELPLIEALGMIEFARAHIMAPLILSQPPDDARDE